VQMRERNKEKESDLLEQQIKEALEAVQ